MGIDSVRASHYGYLEIVRALQVDFLIKHNANVNEKDYNGWTPLHYASFYEHLEIVKYLIGYCDLTIKNNNGQTALDIARNAEIRQIIQDYIDLPDIKEPENN